MNIVEMTGGDVITLSCPQYCCYFILHLSIALQSSLLSCLVLSPFTLPNALHSRFTNISKIMIFSFPCIWLSFPKVFFYYDTLGLCFSLSSLPLFHSSHLISSHLSIIIYTLSFRCYYYLFLLSFLILREDVCHGITSFFFVTRVLLIRIGCCWTVSIWWSGNIIRNKIKEINETKGEE